MRFLLAVKKRLTARFFLQFQIEARLNEASQNSDVVPRKIQFITVLNALIDSFWPKFTIFF